jgi:tetratricopeptide (TPR) repeat protein
MDYNIRSGATFRRTVVVVMLICALSLTGCAGPITRWMVNLRTSQGDAALQKPSLPEAKKEFELALALDPKNPHARAGLAKTLYLTARADFANSRLDEASAEIAEALKYAPSDAATLALAGEIDQAKIRREIVVANYPLYGSISSALKPVFKDIVASNNEVEKQVKLFSNDFDTAHLTRAIVDSYDLEDEAHRMAQRLISYRALVSSGQSKAVAPASAQAPALLPIP